MSTLRNETARNKLIQRLKNLRGDEQPSWGKMSLDQMLSHLVQASEMPFTSSVAEHSNVLTRTVIKPLILYVLPMPKEVKVSAELDQRQKGRKPLGHIEDRELVISLIHKLGTLPDSYKCLNHPFFGEMSAKEWARIAHKHIDHHLKQFGV